jgi:hypothetical protein
MTAADVVLCLLDECVLKLMKNMIHSDLTVCFYRYKWVVASLLLEECVLKLMKI